MKINRYETSYRSLDYLSDLIVKIALRKIKSKFETKTATKINFTNKYNTR